MAGYLSETLGQAVGHVTVTHEQSKESLVGMGATPHIADLFNELSLSLNRGLLKFSQPRNSENSTPTTYPVFAKEVFQTVYNQS